MAPDGTKPLIPEARVDDLDLDDGRDHALWQERLDALAKARLARARERLERMGIIDGEGHLVSNEPRPTCYRRPERA